MAPTQNAPRFNHWLNKKDKYLIFSRLRGVKHVKKTNARYAFKE